MLGLAGAAVPSVIRLVRLWESILTLLDRLGFWEQAQRAGESSGLIVFPALLVLSGPIALADLIDSGVNFNGDDAVVLRYAGGGAIVDVIGQIGFDPGSYWGVAPTKTQDADLRRYPDVCDGDTDGTDAFDPSLEWAGYAVDTWDDLGTHASECEPVPALQSTWGQVKSVYR